MKVPVDLAGIARFLLSDQCRSVVILTGAGISCASGIPDFRSPGTLAFYLECYLPLGYYTYYYY